MMIRRAIATLAYAVTIASGTEYSVSAWQSEDGLPGNVLRSVVQSTDGFIWVASPEGIARFDGVEFETLEMPTDILLPRIGPNRLFATPGGVVWFSGHRGSLLRIENGKIGQILSDRKLRRPWHVSQVVAIDRETIVARRAEETWLVSSDPPRLLNSPDAAIEDALAKDLSLRARRGRILPDGSVARLVDRSKRIWTTHGTLGIRVTTDDGKPLDIDLNTIDQSVNAAEFLQDLDGNIWAATPVSGLLRFRKLRARVMDETNGLSERAVIAISEYPHGKFWLGNRSGGVDRIDGAEVRHFDFSPGTAGPKRPVSALYVDRKQQLWAATRDGSVFKWTGEAFDPAFPRQTEPSKIDTIYQDLRGTYWFGGARGLTRMDNDVARRLGPGDGVPAGHVTIMEGETSGSLWFGTMNGRVYREQDGRILQVGGDADLGKRKVSALLVESATHAWAATLGTGLHFWDGTRWHHIGRQQGLPESRLTCILADDMGYLWLGSLAGIFRVSRVELLSHIRDPLTKLHWLRLDRSDGLPTRECMGSALPSGWSASDGRLFFPTARGLVSITPSQIKANTSPPPVFLKQVRSNGKHLELIDGRFTDGPGRSRLEFNYHGLDFSSPEKMSYRTRLTGLDDTWREIGGTRSSTYEAVPPGTYQFEVSAINGDGVSSAKPASAEIVIRPHFWETSWFWILSITMAIGIAAGTGWIIARVRLKRRIQSLKLKQSLEAERARISRDLHDDLGASLTELSILSALAAENPDHNTLRSSLGHLSGKAKTVVGTLDEIVWAATPSEDSLRSLVEYLSAFAREFLENVEITLRADVIRNIPDIQIGPNRRHNVFLAARESLNNAVKHANATEIHLGITIEDKHLVIRIRDNGRGFPVEYASSGDGLSNLKKRMADCGGTCTIQSKMGEGTTVSLTLPLPQPLPPGK